MELSDKMLTEISYIQISSYRTRVLKSIGDGVKIPSQIAKDANIHHNHISNVLRQLKEHDLVECINPEVKRGRLYRLTDKGKKILSNIN